VIKDLRHVGIVVADLNLALKFWRDTLQFTAVKQMDESGAHIDAVMGLDNVEITTVKLMAPAGGMIELLHFKSHPDTPSWVGKPYSTGLTHIAMTVDDLDSTVTKLKNDASVKLFCSPQYSPDGAVKFLYCVGPEGLLLELVEHLK
jgi:catechol 2,3-dioxygenase-like lactoylglutathione lyase family enzyme